MAPECYATKNICTYFCLPDGTVLHYFTGYFSPKPFLAEVEFATALREKAVDGEGAVKVETLKQMHKDRPENRTAEIVAARGGDRSAPNPSYREGMDYLDKINEEFVKEGARPLETVKKKHLSGNKFAEETSRSGSRKRPEEPKDMELPPPIW